MGQRSNELQVWHVGVPSSVRTPTIVGFLVLGLSVVGFGGWASNAPIEGAVVAPGAFVATGQNKIVQHLEGGIIREILVQEGNRVEEGQVLIRLDPTAAQTRLRRLELRLARLTAMEQRLRAEAQGYIPFSALADTAYDVNDPDVKAMLESQDNTFAARRDKLLSEIAIHEQSILAFRELVAGGEAQIASIEEQIEYIDEELSGKFILMDKGLMKKPDLLALQRARARLVGEIGRVRSEIGEAQERIVRARQQIDRAKTVDRERAVDELHTVGSDIQDVVEQIRANRDILDRVDIASPTTGIVVKLRYNTPGGVIEPGKDILEIVPIKADLIIEARVRPQDIDNVKLNQDAVVSLIALNRRITPMALAKVIYVSADTLPDDQRGRPTQDDVYVVRVEIQSTANGMEVKDFNPTAGMPVEVFIKTGERTFFQYLLQPLIDSMSRAFREA